MKVKLVAALVAVVAAVAAVGGNVQPASAATAGQATTMNRSQAVRSARDYLQVSAFSLKGLAKQLRFEGYSASDAWYGASHAGANWMVQAVKSARAYLQVSAFSFSGMVRQLQFEGFTRAQAVHGARALHL